MEWSNGWYPVDGVWQPHEEEIVLVATQNMSGRRDIDKGYRKADGRWVHRGSARVTHWMPLPPLPEEGIDSGDDN